MTSESLDQRAPSRRDLAYALPICTMVLAASASTLAIAIRQIDGLYRTIALLWIVVAIAAVMIARTAIRLRDDALMKLGYVWAVKLILVLTLLIVGWMPMLDPASSLFGYDPQRYYFDAETLRLSGFDIRALPILNYTGILYLYGGMFVLFGHNPVAPALVNIFLTLVATLVLVRAGYAAKGVRSPHDWTLGLAMVVPDVIWFDALTSRETLTMSCLTIGILGIGAYFTTSRRPRAYLLIAPVLALTVVGIVRTTVFFIALAAIGGMYLLAQMSWRRRLAAIVPVAFFVGLLFVWPQIAQRIGSYNFDIREVLSIANRASRVLSEEGYTWSDRSLGRLLVQQSAAGIVLLSPVRMVAYLIIPFPNVHPDIDGLAAGSWYEWQGLMLALSAVIYIVFVPCAFASLIDVIRRRAGRMSTAIHLGAWLSLLGAAVGNQIMQERYRVVGILLLWGAIWLGFGSSRRTLLAAYACWLIALTAGAAVFFAYKFML